MASQAQLDANRANAQKSTGPQSDAGKDAAAENSRKLGLTCRIIATLDYESDDDLLDYRDRLVEDFEPANTLELTLINQIAQHHQLAQRAIMAQEGCFRPDFPMVADKDAERRLALYLRYQTTHERAFHKAHQELAKMQAARKAAFAKEVLAKTKVVLAQQQIKQNKIKLGEPLPPEMLQPTGPIPGFPQPVADELKRPAAA